MVGTRPALANPYMENPITNVLMMVPSTANSKIVLKLLKKLFLRSEYPASKMIGGSRRKKKVSG